MAGKIIFTPGLKRLYIARGEKLMCDESGRPIVTRRGSEWRRLVTTEEKDLQSIKIHVHISCKVNTWLLGSGEPVTAPTQIAVMSEKSKDSCEERIGFGKGRRLASQDRVLEHSQQDKQHDGRRRGIRTWSNASTSGLLFISRSIIIRSPMTRTIKPASTMRLSGRSPTETTVKTAPSLLSVR